MPTLILKTSVALTDAAAAEIAQALTQLTGELLHKRPEVTAVVVEASPRLWTIGGVSSARPTAFLEISVTEGTNTAEEKSAFIAATYSELGRRLAGRDDGLALASYVIVRELPAADWGYGGETQAARARARQAAAVAAVAA